MNDNGLSAFELKAWHIGLQMQSDLNNSTEFFTTQQEIVGV